MKNKLKMTFVVLTIVLMLSAFWVSTAPAVTDAYLEVLDDGSVDGVADNKVVFGQNTLALGEDFEVEVYLMNIDPVQFSYLDNASFALKYDTTVITVVSVVIDPIWTGPNSVGVVPGEIQVFVRGPLPTPAPVLIATITFRVVNQEESPPFPVGYYDYSPLDIQDVVLWSTTGEIPHAPAIDGEVYVYAYKIQVYLEVLDDGSVDGVADNKVVLDENTQALGEDFDVEVYLMDLDVTLALHNASFALKYDTTVITVVAVVIDPVWLGPNMVGVIPGEIYIFVQDPHPTPAGNILIADITFRVVNQEESPPFPQGYYDYSPLDFQDILLYSLEAEIPYEPAKDGEVYVYAYLREIQVHVDVKPGSWPNPLRLMDLKGEGVLPGAICGTEDFDVTTIDPETVQLTLEGLGVGVAPLRWSYEDVATPYEGGPCSGHDLDGDGYLDLTLKFKTQEVIETLGLDAFSDGDVVILILTGNLKMEHGGTPIQGQDCIVIRGK